MFWRGCEWEEVATVETRGDGWSMTYAIDSHGCPVGVGGSWPGFQWDAEAQACVMDLTVTGGVEEFRSLILRVRGPRGEVCGEWLVSEHVNGAE